MDIRDDGSPEYLRIERGKEALDRLRRDSTWEDWLAVGVAIDIGRQHALQVSGKNTPGGKGYNTAFSKWLKENGFGSLDGGDRKRLMDCMDHRGEIEEWRKILTVTQRMKLNHPSTVWRQWQASQREPRSKGESKPTTLQKTEEALAISQEALAISEREISGLKAQVEELEAARAEPASQNGRDTLIAELQAMSREERADAIRRLMAELDLTQLDLLNSRQREREVSRPKKVRKAPTARKPKPKAAKKGKLPGQNQLHPAHPEVD
jgi:hypothetical protein